jgi:hypothetical protein
MARPDHRIYRCYGDAEEADLLYVGRTGRGEERLREHAHTAAWWPEVDHCTVAEQTLHGTGHAARVEKKAIEDEHPRHNVVHNRRP